MAAWDERSPHFCEAGHVRTYAYYAGVTGCPLYVVHTTTRETLDEIKKARQEGVKVYSQTGHHYLSLSHDVWKINVPLRDEETMGILWDSLRDAEIDCIGSDHVDWGMSRAQMDKGNVWETSSGFPSRVEALLPVLLTEGVHKGRISLERLVEACCESPARVFGIYPKKAAISVGSDADFVIVDLDRTMRVAPEMIHSSAGCVHMGRQGAQGLADDDHPSRQRDHGMARGRAAGQDRGRTTRTVYPPEARPAVVSCVRHHTSWEDERVRDMEERDLEQLTISQLAGQIESREVSPVDLTNLVFERIERLNPVLNAFVTLTKDQALADAGTAAKEIESGHYRGPLHGIPLSIKDNNRHQGRADHRGVKDTLRLDARP